MAKHYKACAKRLSEEDSTSEVSTTTKKARLDTDSLLPTFDFNSILDKAMQKFEEQMNNINTK
ncbi:hypothetical protein V8B55DRAFT_1440730 [Mucor lusitanicus]|uniref:Uncharacterized protein n=1 Tax=Mucor lusitanicus CBS 277.49 TaxID=747725 RepID=A0A168NSP9_MUCCL|nr:hypothetical protein MUCCIDRAFT_107267 [Mucor lusitanicus CBS 277.49]